METQKSPISLAELDAEAKEILAHYGQSARDFDTLVTDRHRRESSARFYSQWLKRIKDKEGTYTDEEVTALLDPTHPGHAQVMEKHHWLSRLRAAKHELKAYLPNRSKRSTTAH